MKKTLIVISFAFMFVQCTNTDNQRENNASSNEQATKDTTKTEEKDAHSCVMPDSKGKISKQVKIVGDVEFPLNLTVDSLKRMNVVTIENFQVVCQSGANMKDVKSCKGVLLKELLEKAKIIQNNHKDRNFYIVARATDGYKATFSWGEIFNNPTGENVYILFEENEAPIKEQGEMILVCTTDIKTGPRHVYWLESIEVKRVE